MSHARNTGKSGHAKPVQPSPDSNTPLPGPAATAAPQAHDRAAMVAEAAYFLAEKRNFLPGGELDDWLTAERELNLKVSTGTSQISAP